MRNAEELSQRSLDHFPNRDLLFSMPELRLDFRIVVTLNPKLRRSEIKANMEVVTVAGGKWSGTFGNGSVMVCVDSTYKTIYLTAVCN